MTKIVDTTYRIDSAGKLPLERHSRYYKGDGCRGGLTLVQARVEIAKLRKLFYNMEWMMVVEEEG